MLSLAQENIFQRVGSSAHCSSSVKQLTRGKSLTGKIKPLLSLIGNFNFPHQISQRGCGISKLEGGIHSLQLASFGLGRSLASRHGQSRSAGQSATSSGT